MTNLFGIDLKPLMEKVSEFTVQQKQIIALLKENNQIQAHHAALLEEITQLLKTK